MKREAMTTRALRAAAAAALAAAFGMLSACTPSGGAIFATIEQEDETVESNLPDTVSVTDVLELRAGGVTSFVAVARTLFLGVQSTAGDNASLDWKALSLSIEETPGSGVTTPSPGSTCRSAVLVPGATAETDRIFAVLAAPPEGGETTALYRSTPPATIAADELPTLEWSTAVSTGLDGRPEGVFLVNGELFVTARTSTVVTQYALYHYDVSLDTATVVIALTQVPVADGAFHDSAYWFIAGNRLYTGALPGPFALTADTTIASPAASYGGVHASDTTLHLSTGDGKLHVRPAGGAWTASAALTLTSDDAALSFTDFASIGTGAGEQVFVGSEGRGFFRLTGGLLDQEALAAARMPDRTLSELYAGTILGFVRRSNVIFVRTAGAGLWHQVVDADLPLKGWVWD